MVGRSFSPEGGISVEMAVEVCVGVGVGVIVGVSVGVAVEVSVDVGVSVGVSEGVGVEDPVIPSIDWGFVGVEDCVGVYVGVGQSNWVVKVGYVPVP